MTVQVDLETVRANINASWIAFQETLSGLTPEQLIDPTAVGYWSVGDLAFHIAFWDDVFVGDSQYRHDHNGERSAPRDWQSMNDAVYAEHKGQSASEGFGAMESSHRAAMAVFDTFPTDDFSWAIGELVDHYDEHARDIQAWRAARGI